MVRRDIPQAKFEILVDAAKCTGCGSCELICSLYHDEVTSPSSSRIHVVRDALSGENSIEVCRQCQGPECMQVCPVEEAMVVDEKTGARTIVEDECIGCGNCFRACPFNTESFIISHRPQKNVYVKCDLCYRRDRGPACAEICPHDALIYISHR
ncbi:MAG: 4Fe-4S dicluster domain-containing protein [Aigarchaeota archaeon]|nr:4Fe-4S dicluster domain-containing protein [Aigarchaeota archaeon]